MNHVVSPRFRRVVTLHIAKNFLASSNYRPPLLLGIHGPSGDGKTYQCELVLRELNVRPVFISGGELESDHAGQPARLIRDRYQQASEYISTGSNAAVMINDFDTGVGSWGDKVQYTVNRQLVFAEMMHLVDEPHNVAGVATHRVPVIITGNDFTRLHPPLTRAGRMTAFEWIPTAQERASIVTGIFPELTHTDCVHMVTTLERRRQQVPIAFYSALRTTLVDDALWQHIENARSPMIETISRLRGTPLLTRLTVEECIEVGSRLLKDGSLVNHLRGSVR